MKLDSRVAAVATIAIVLGIGAPTALAAARHDPASSSARKHKPAKHVVKCASGQAQLRIGKRVICMHERLPPTTLQPQQAAVANAFAFALGPSRRDRRHHRGKSFAKLLQRLGPNARKKAEQAVLIGLQKGELLLLGSTGAAKAASRRTAFAADSCSDADLLEELRKKYDSLSPEEKATVADEIAKLEAKGSFKDGDGTATLDIGAGGIKFGLEIKGKGIRVSFSVRQCGGQAIKTSGCPTADGKVEGEGRSEFEFKLKAYEGDKLVVSQGLRSTANTTIKAQVGDDAQLDGYDIKHVYETTGTFGGSKTTFGPITVNYTYIGEAHVDLRTGGGAPPPAVVDVRLAAAGADPRELIAVEIEMAHKAQAEADKEFSATIDKATSALREDETNWRKPKACAKLVFEPGNDKRTVAKGESNTFKSTTEAAGGGAPAAVKWAISAPANATFTPSGGAGNPLTTSYHDTNAGKDVYVEATVTATSKAGVAEERWREKTGEPLTTLTGTFTGRSDNKGEVFEWTGTATLKHIDLGTIEVSRAFELVSGEAKVVASGPAIGTGCEQKGSEILAISPASTWAVENQEAPFAYQMVLPFNFPGGINTTWTNCSEPANNGVASFGSIPTAALRSGEISAKEPDPTALTKHTSDLYVYEGSTSATGPDGETLEWTWSFKGLP
jgi:hypothetical protein